MTLDIAVVLARWAFFAAATACFGLALFPFYAAPAGSDARHAIASAAGLALAAALAWLGMAIVSFGGRDPQSFVSTAGTVLFASRLGAPWLVRFAAGLTLLIAATLRARALLLLALATVLVSTEAWIGHGAVHGWGYKAAQAAHVLAAGAWLGGLLALLGMLHDRRIGDDRAAGVLLRFSAIGVVSVVVIGATGVFSTWITIGRVPETTGAFDRLVLVKVALFLAMLGIAAYNRFRLLPALAAGGSGTSRAMRRLKCSILAEQSLGLAVLFFAARLGVTSPS